jgi:glutathione S-transferase
MKLVIADKNYSSWSMRPWVLMKHFGIAFDEELIEMARDDTRARMLARSPTGRVPCLLGVAGEPVWDSLAICETLAELHPQQALWPADVALRARARSVSAEMHSGFTSLRGAMPMNIREHAPGYGATPEALADVARVDALWRDCLAYSGGPFLCGEFSIADAMFAPVVMRFNSYVPVLSDEARAYCERMTAVPAVAAWIADARGETHVIEYYRVAK